MCIEHRRAGIKSRLAELVLRDGKLSRRLLFLSLTISMYLRFHRERILCVSTFSLSPLHGPHHHKKVHGRDKLRQYYIVPRGCGRPFCKGTPSYQLFYFM